MSSKERKYTPSDMRYGFVAALILLLGSGAAYRLMAARLMDVSGGVPLPAGTLSRLPLSIAGWEGVDVPLTDAVIRATDTDDHVNRLYRRRGGIETAALFVAYGVRFRDLAPHRPEVCYPGAGWTLEATTPLDLALPDGSPLPCQLHHFSRAGLDAQRVAVLNYYIVDGGFHRDVSSLRSLAWRLEANASYVAQIQVTCSLEGFLDRTAEAAQIFAAQSAPEIRSVLVQAVKRAVQATGMPPD
jgi:EpsI family protein